MPGMVASVAVAKGQQVKRGDLLMTIEAMKMETAIHAQRDGTIAEVAAPAGTQVDAKDLLIAFD
jgi:pyruvate carboxylase